jgi:hypothetical protein
MKLISCLIHVLLLCLLMASCASPKTEESKSEAPDSSLTLHTEKTPTVAPVETALYTVSTDNPEIKGTWVSPQLSNTDFGYRIALTDEKFIATYSGNSEELTDIEGSWWFQSNRLTLVSENDSIIFTVRSVQIVLCLIVRSLK